MNITDMIPTGRKNAVRLPGSGNRKLRAEINKANKNGVLIINTGNGYFKPDLTDAGDVAELNHYLASELHRAREILFKRLNMKNAVQAAK